MLSITLYNEDKEKISIFSENETLARKGEIVKTITDILAKHGQIEYYIYICGLGATIEDYIAEIKSDKYIFIDEYRYKWFVKELPELHLISEYQCDIITLTHFLDSFNEGNIMIQFIKVPNTKRSFNCNKEEITDYANKNAMLQVSIHSDGEVYEIENLNDYSNLIHICSDICEKYLKNNR